MAGDTKQRMIEATALALRQRGLAATSFTEVLAASGAARGAIYHHFPGGKEELAEHAVEWTGRRVRDEIQAIEGDDPDQVLDGFVARIRPVVAKAVAGTSCAVAVVTAEASPEQAALTAAAGVAFRSWIDALETQLVRAGASAERARALGRLMIVFLEGSIVIARATGTLDIFDESAAALLRAARASET